MAKIAGFELKAVKSFKDHDGYPIYQGNVYFKGKKLGSWSQDGWGGPDYYDFDETPYSDALAKVTAEDYPVLKSCFDMDIEPNMDILMSEILDLKDIEKHYKSFIKKGYVKMAKFGSKRGRTEMFGGIADTDEGASGGLISAVAERLGCNVEEVKVEVYDADSFTVGLPLKVA